MSEKAEKMQVGGKFQKGQSGNPNGKAKGTKNKATLAAAALLEGEIETICRRLIQEALSGNMQAIKMVLDRVLLCRKEYPVKIDLPIIKQPQDAIQAISIIVTAVGGGCISPQQGEVLSKIVEVYVKAVETHEFERRLADLEEKKTENEAIL